MILITGATGDVRFDHPSKSGFLPSRRQAGGPIAPALAERALPRARARTRPRSADARLERLGVAYPPPDVRQRTCGVQRCS